MLHCTMLDLWQPRSLDSCGAANDCNDFNCWEEKIMAMSVTGSNGFHGFAKAFEDFRLPGFDLDSVTATHRKNIETLAQIGQIAAEGMHAVARCQAEIMHHAFAEASGLLRKWTQPDAPEQLVVTQIEAAKQSFEKSVADVRELAELTAKTGTDVFSVVARRVSESFDDTRLYAKKLAAAE